MHFQRLLITAIAVQGLSSTGLCASQATFQLFTPAGTDNSVKAADISADGSVVVGTSDSEAFRWTAAGGYQRLGWLPDPNPTSFANAVSADGSIVVGSCNSTLHVAEAFRWDAVNGMVHLEPISYASGLGLSVANAIGNNGSMIGGYSYDINIDQPTVWTTPTTPQYIGEPGTTFTGGVFDIADSAPVVVGYNEVPGINFVGSTWTPGLGLTYVLPAGFDRSFLERVSSDGSTVFGRASVGQGESFTFRWNANHGYEMLPTGIPTAQLRTISAIDGEGTSGVGQYRVGPYNTPSQAFYWSEATGLVHLRDYLFSRGATPFVPNERLQPLAMSADGNVIIGNILPGIASPSPHPYWFMARLSPTDPQPIGAGYCGPSAQNSVGQSPTLQAIGSVHVADNDLRLAAEGLPANVFGIVLASQTQASVPNFAGSLGTLCLGGSVGRFNRHDQIRHSGPFERIALQVNLSDIAQPLGSTAIQPGQTWNFQLWYRDRTTSGSVSNLTSATSITFQ
ncbi:MAG: hypothetical protein P1V35_15745 [Planctomycetota bacterium]|nr:hypothetical protein [Planctomycetota bacterium]